MGEQPTFTSEAVDWSDIGWQLTQGLLKRVAESDLPKHVISTLVEKEAVLQGIMFDVMVEVALKLGKVFHELEGPFLPVIAGFTAPIVGGLFGAEVNEAEFARRLSRGDGAAAGQAIVGGLFKAIAGDAAAGTPAPGDEGARRIAGAAVAAALESTFNAMIPELLSDLVPEFGHFTAFTELPEAIIRSLGVGRLVRRAIGPLVTATCTTPLQWHVNKLYPSALLSPASAARQIARGFGNKDAWLEDIRRAGYSEDRIAALLNEQAHYFGASDVRTFVTRGWWDNDRGLKHLRDQGYDENAATDALRLEGLRRIDQLETAEANAIITAYVAGDIDEGTFRSALNAAVTVASERALLEELAAVRKAVNVKHLSLSQVEAMVKSGVLSVPDYRDAARRDGYDDFAVTALELQLRWELDKTKKIETHRAELEATREADRKAKADAAAAKKAEIEAQRVLERRGRRADLERAAVRGLIDLDRVQEIYTATYDADTVAILMDLLETDRHAYLDQQAARDAALKRGAVRGVDVGALEAAVVEHVLTLEQFRARLLQEHFAPEDAAILVDTLAAKMQDRADAEDARTRAAEAAKVKHVNLDTIEMLVRRGHRTLTDYDRTLQQLGFGDADRAAMIDRLQLLINDDAAARDAHAAAEAKARTKGLSFEQFRRAVILGVKTLDQFQTFMVAQGYTGDAQQTLLAELRFDVTEADAARRRRAEADAAKDSRDAPLSDVARAARLGLIPVADYQARLVRSGYSDDDVAIEIDLLVQEMTDRAATQAERAAAEAAAQNRGLSLAQIERAVRAGHATVDTYRSAAVAAGLSPEAADTLAAVLRDELEAQAAAERRRQEIADAAAVRHVSLGQLEAAVKGGLASLDDYRTAVLELGYGDEDVALLAGLLAKQLAVIQEAEDRRAAAVTRHPDQHATLAQLEDGVKEGLLTMGAFVAELRSRGFGEAPLLRLDEAGRAVLDETSDGPFDDTELIALLLQVRLDAAATKAGG